MPGAYLDRSPANSWPSVQYNKLDNPHIVEFAPNVVMDDRDFPIANRVFAGPLRNRIPLMPRACGRGRGRVRVAPGTRVSTDDQAREECSPAAQAKRLR